MIAERPRFLTPRMSILLDLVRAGAAGVVLLGHAGSLGLFGAGWPLDNSFQHSAVVVFFVLSGLMIQQSATRDGVTAATFARARLSRIVPVAIFAVAFSSLVFAALRGVALPVDPHHRYDVLSPRTVLLPLLFLSERGDGIGPALDPPYWSLCYEVWFYVIYGLFHYTRGVARLACVAAAIVVADAAVILLLPTWLLGVALGAWGDRVPLGRPRLVLLLAVAGFALTSWSGLFPAELRVLGLLGLTVERLRFSSFFLLDLVASGFVALALLAASRLPGDPSPLERVARRGAGLSFTLYLTHWPLLILATLLPPLPFGARGVVALAVPLLFAALMSPFLERTVPAWLRGDRHRPRPPVVALRRTASA